MIRWRVPNRMLIATLSAIALYFFLSSGYREYELSGVVPHTKPEDVWDFLADFSHMKRLNPTIIDFKVISESGYRNDWKYTVSYEEKLSHWPYTYNHGLGHYMVTKLSEEHGGVYSVASKHRTCFLPGLFCPQAEGEFTIRHINDHDTLVTEVVRYTCPFFFGSFCRREVEYQRHEIMRKLKEHFEHLRHQKMHAARGRR
ncbi:uncharacterized protein LOC118463899 [Anopheles albimanus]|uniref:uncharacterized protein LOC118463899 n=1 Tax=Anopheles albimanus TaxID=7167 RepID=UPI00163EB35A|nr:uncharacterized protein LOC118463899 [Anopheles albimanus]